MRTTDVYAMSRFGCLNTKSNSKCNNCPKEMRRDVSCINIILRSDCKMHSNQYNCVQKEEAQNENEPATQDKEHLIQTNMLGLDSSNKNYHSICFNADNHFNMSQTMGIKYEAKLGRPSRQQFSSPNELYNYAACVRENSLNVSQSGMRNGAKCNQCTEQSTSSNTPQIEYGKFSRYPFHSTAISDDVTNNKLISSKINSTNLGKSDQNNKIETRFDAHKFDVKRDIKSHPKISWKNFPKYELQNSKNKELVNFEKNDTDKQHFASVPRDIYNKPLFQNSITLGNSNLNSTSINELVNSKFQRIENSLSSTDYKHSICTNRMQNILKNSYEEHTSSEKNTFNKISSTRKKLNFSVQDDINPCTDTNCTKINCAASTIKREKNHKSTRTDIKSTNDVTTNTFLKSTKNVCCNEKKEEKKSTKTIDSVLDTLQNMLNEVKKLEDTGTVKQYAQGSCYQEVRCKNMDCNYLDGRHEVAILECKHNSVKPPEIITPECMKMLQEIKEYTKTLEEQLMIMNKSMKIKKKTIEKLMPTVEYVMDLKYNQSIYNTRQQRDIITQNPEKRNICIQEPSKDINCVNCPQNTTIKMKEVHNEKQDLALPEVNKKNKYQSENEQESKNFKEEEIKDNKKENSNVKVTFNVQDQIKRHDNIKKKTQNVQVQCIRSFHIIDPLNCRPLSTCMCNKGVNVSNDKNSPCIQTCVANKKNLYTQRIDKTMIDKLIIDTVKMKDITNSVNVNNAQESLTYEERAIMMLLLAKGISNKCLKSKYKKSEFINFRPKCITNSCISCDQRSVKCKSSKQKMQIPVVFKQSEAIKCRIEGNICCNKSKYECSPKQLENDYQLSNLMTVCTQSSNLQITTATSVSCTSISTKSVVDNVIEEKRPRGESCILS